MAKIGTMNVGGKSGTQYAFDLYPIETDFRSIGAIYIITERTEKPTGGGSHAYVYIGQTGDLSNRFDDHHKQECFDNNGANCIGIHLDDSEDSRLSKETDLCDGRVWPCNG